MATKKKAKKKAAKKKAVRRGAAATPTVKSIKDPMTKSAIYTQIAEKTDLKRKDVVAVFDELTNIINGHVKRNGAGMFTLPGLLKVKVVRKKATRATTRPNPFVPGEMMQVKAKPARNVVKILALKGLKDMVN